MSSPDTKSFGVRKELLGMAIVAIIFGLMAANGIELNAGDFL